MGRHAQKYEISEDDRLCLKRLLRAGTTPQNIAFRAKIILLSSSGMSADEVKNKLETSKNTVYCWRKRFKEHGIKGLYDLPRSGQPKKLSQEKVQEVLRMTTEGIPNEATHWSLRLMSKAAGISVWHVSQIWKDAGLKPHLIKNFKISNDPKFAEKVTDIVGLYMNPPENAMVLSVDEKTQIQALDRTQPMLQLRPGQIERRTHDYKRNGITNLYAALNIKTGKVIGRTTKKHRAIEFLDFLRQINKSTPDNLDLHIILDNSSTHKTEEVKKWLSKNPRFKLHFTPTSASWLNAVERWFAEITRRALYRGNFSSVNALNREIHRFIEVHNERSAKPFKWIKKADAIIKRVETLKQKINQTGH